MDFVQKHSTYMALLEMLDKLTLGFERKITLARFIDHTKSFQFH